MNYSEKTVEKFAVPRAGERTVVGCLQISHFMRKKKMECMAYVSKVRETSD